MQYGKTNNLENIQIHEIMHLQRIMQSYIHSSQFLVMKLRFTYAFQYQQVNQAGYQVGASHRWSTLMAWLQPIAIWVVILPLNCHRSSIVILCIQQSLKKYKTETDEEVLIQQQFIPSIHPSTKYLPQFYSIIYKLLATLIEGSHCEASRKTNSAIKSGD